MNEIVIIVAKYFIVLPFLAAAIVFWQLKKKDRLSYSIALIGGGLLALLLAHIASSLYYNPRPFMVGHFTPLIAHAAGNGFPSDHTLLAAFIGWTTLRYTRKYGVIVLAIALLIGLARVFAGVHHLEDIIASFIISGIAVAATGFVLDKLNLTKRVRRAVVSSENTLR